MVETLLYEPGHGSLVVGWLYHCLWGCCHMYFCSMVWEGCEQKKASNNLEMLIETTFLLKEIHFNPSEYENVSIFVIS